MLTSKVTLLRFSGEIILAPQSGASG
ncbi:MAG: hypothetical protein ACD_62C00245G0005, partial [uncultured bacterium]